MVAGGPLVVPGKKRPQVLKVFLAAGLYVALVFPLSACADPSPPYAGGHTDIETPEAKPGMATEGPANPPTKDTPRLETGNPEEAGGEGREQDRPQKRPSTRASSSEPVVVDLRDRFPQPPLPPDLPKKSGPPSPLSGRAGGGDARLLAVKIDNTSSAQPHTGVHHADLVYVQEVEGGLTRLLALYGTHVPHKVAPVRSARISDISLLEPFGTVALAYSGAQSRLLPELKGADIVDLSPVRRPELWGFQSWRPVSWNNHVALAREMLASSSTARARDMGWLFSGDVPGGGVESRGVVCRWPASTIGFSWSSKAQGYVLEIDGVRSTSTEGGPLVAATVVVQFVRQSKSGYGDRYGGVTPLIETVGSGDALVLRDGRKWKATWRRDAPQDATSYVFVDGATAVFRTGQLWVVLLDEKLRNNMTIL